MFSSPSSISFAQQFKNNKLIRDQYNLISNFYGFDIGEASHKNLQTMRHLLTQGTDGILNFVTNPNDKSYFANFNFAKSLSSAEEIIFKEVLHSSTLRHGTKATEAIQKTGKLQAVRSLEASGKIEADRHTSYRSGLDLSTYHVYGMGNHKVPPFVRNSSHIITTKLAEMEATDPLTTKRLWVSAHQDEYLHEREHFFKLGDVKFSIKHKKNYTKTYLFEYPSGETLKWKLNYQDEIFAGYETAPGIALQFIFLLRLLGGEQNELIKQLYVAANTQGNEFKFLLEKILSTVMMGWVYPEAKIIEELNINNHYVSIDKNKHDRNQSEEYYALEDAVRTANLNLVKLFLKKGFPVKNSRDNLLAEAIENIRDDKIRLSIMKELIAHGVEPIKKDDFNNPLLTAIKKGTAEDLDFLLSQEYPDPTLPSIRRIVNPNAKFSGMHYDLIECACGNAYSTEIFKVLKKHGADFKKNGTYYLNCAINAYDDHMSVPNYSAINFLFEEGISPDDPTIFNHTPLMNACKKGDLVLVRFLVEIIHANLHTPLKYREHSLLAGKTFYDSPSNGMTALHVAARAGNLEIVAYLISKGADPNLKTLDGRTALDLVDKDKVELIDLLTPMTKPSIQSDPSEPESNQVENKTTFNEKNSLAHHHKVATLVTGINSNGQRYVVLGKPRVNNLPWYKDRPQHYCFPGGSANKSDKSLQHAAMRELFEETGIDVQKIPSATIKEIGSFKGFTHYEHETTTFFLVDVGQGPISVHPCDDLVDVKKIFVEKLNVNNQNPIAKQIHHGEETVLGSNALIIQNIILNSSQFNIDEQNKIQNQLLIEAQGYQILFNLIDHAEESEIKPGTATWIKIENLLKNNAHLYKDERFRKPLTFAMLKQNSLEGIELLQKYGYDITDWCYDFTINDNEYFGSVLAYAIILNRLDWVKHLISLDNKFLHHEIHDENILNIAIKLGHTAIVDYLLDQGFNPNQSYENKDVAGSFQHQPLISLAIENNQINLAKHLLNDDRIFLNRERSRDCRKTVLMTAIEKGNVDDVLMLLATNRINLNETSKPKSDYYSEKKGKTGPTALEMAGSNKVYDVISPILFQNMYMDMNQFLSKNELPMMDSFVPTMDEHNKPIIHFVSTDLAKLSQLNEKFKCNSPVFSKDGKYYLAFDQKRLGTLLKNEKIASYLLTYTKDSVFWTNRSDHFRNLQKSLIENKENTLSVVNLDHNDEFTNLSHKNYYQQLIKENVSVKNLIIDLSYKNQNIIQWLLNAVQNHDKIENVVLCATSNGKNLKNNLWSKALDVTLSLSKLNSITCNELPIANVIELLQRISAANDFHQNIIIQDQYTSSQFNELLKNIKEYNIKNIIRLPNGTDEQQQLLNQIIEQNQLAYYTKTDRLFAETIEKIKNEEIFSLFFSSHQPFDDSIKNHLYYKLKFQYSNVKLLNINSFNQDELPLLADFIRKNNTIETIGMSLGCGKNSFSVLLKTITESKAPLKKLDLSYHTFKEADIRILIDLIKSHSLEMLNLDNTKFKTNDVKLISELGNAIAENPHLNILKIDWANFYNGSQKNSEDKNLKELFIKLLGKSASLVQIKVSLLEKLPNFLVKTLQRNCQLYLTNGDSLEYNKQSSGRFFTRGKEIKENTNPQATANNKIHKSL